MNEGAASFPEGLPESDRARWSTLTASQRAKAGARIAAFRDWTSGVLSVEQAVAASGLSRSRFYRLAAEWRAAPSLDAVGAQTGAGAAGSRLDPDAVNALQAVVADVVRQNGDASVSQLVRLMVERAKVPEERLPGAVRLRSIVETELRRVAATGEAGHAVQFDCTAMNLPQANGRPFIMLACLDTGTGLILGAACAERPEAEGGYRAVALDARDRIAGTLARLPWALRLTRIELTAGSDDAQSLALLERLSSGTAANVQLARTDKRFGKYFRKVVGERIGRIAITPARTLQGSAMPDNGDMSPWTLSDAAAALAVEVEAHNQAVLAGLRAEPRGSVPEDLQLALELLAGA